MRYQKIAALSLAAGMALCLSACNNPGSTASSAVSSTASSAVSSAAATAAPTEAPSSSASDSAASESKPANPGELTAADIGRPETAVLQRSAEGEIEDMPATLFIGEGYSFYLTDDTGWDHVQTASTKKHTPDVFVPAANDQVMLSIMPDYEELTLQEAYDAKLEENYTQSDDNDHVFTDGGADGMLSTWYIVEYSGRVWYISYSFPDTTECMEGWGTMLPVIAESFAVH